MIDKLYPLDDPKYAADIITFWKRGTASSFETNFITLYLGADLNLRARLAFVFPAFTKAIEDYLRGK